MAKGSGTTRGRSWKLITSRPKLRDARDSRRGERAEVEHASAPRTTIRNPREETRGSIGRRERRSVVAGEGKREATRSPRISHTLDKPKIRERFFFVTKTRKGKHRDCQILFWPRPSRVPATRRRRRAPARAARPALSRPPQS